MCAIDSKRLLAGILETDAGFILRALGGEGIALADGDDVSCTPRAPSASRWSQPGAAVESLYPIRRKCWITLRRCLGGPRKLSLATRSW